ncbi:MAG: CehA/McbA family metallohydrolase [Planctomycetaceae bacterium]
MNPRAMKMSVAVLLTLAVSMPVQADEALHELRVRILGDDNSPAAARVVVRASDSREVAPEGAAVRKTKAGESYFYADGSFQAEVPPGRMFLKVSGGLEFVPQTVLIDANSDAELTVHLQRWVDMASRGWYSGDSHVHLNTGGTMGVTVADALVAARAEGVNFVNLCISNNKGDDIRDADMISGRPEAISTDRHLLVFGEEMRSSIYGHMQFFGIQELVEPQYTGFDDTPNHFDFPANYVMAAEACRQGGVVTYGHPMFAGQPSAFSDDLTAGSGAARELPVDAILNVTQAVDLMSYNSDEDLSAELWYRLLNCGLKLSACVGTDALLDQSTEPMGGSRVYVKTNGPLTMENWLDGLANGRTFVTNGPILQLSVNGAEPGDSLSAESDSVRVKAVVESHVPFDHVEIIVNGTVAVDNSVAAASGACNGSAVSVRSGCSAEPQQLDRFASSRRRSCRCL